MKKKLKPLSKNGQFSSILKKFNLSDKAIDLYNSCHGSELLSLNEIKGCSGIASEKDLNITITELIDNKLMVKVESENPVIITHYAIISPFSIIKKGLTTINDKIAKPDENITQKINEVVKGVFESDKQVEISSLLNDFDKFKSELESDLNKVKEELVELGDNIEGQVDSSTKFLDKYQESLVNAFRAQMTGILIVLLQFKADFEENLKTVGISNEQWIAIRDLVKDLLAKEIHVKTQELSEMLSGDFNEIKTELNEMISRKFKDRFEQQAVYVGILNIFLAEMKKFDDIINKKSKEFNSGTKKIIESIGLNTYEAIKSDSQENQGIIKSVQEALDILINEKTDIDKLKPEDLWSLNNKIVIKEEISNLLKLTKNELVIIVPQIEDFIPVEEMDLKFVEEEKEKMIGKTRKVSAEDLGVEAGPSEKELIINLKESLTSIKKTAFEKKGFEISHDIAELMAIVSDINPNSVILESIRNWLNRLLVIRKVLDQNLRLILLQDIEKWENDYNKSVQPEEEIEDESSQLKEDAQKPVEEQGLRIKICTSTKHNDKYSKAIKNTPLMEYKKIKNNPLIAIKADNSLIIFGIYLDNPRNPDKNTIGFISNNEQMIQMLEPIISDKWERAHYAKTIRISQGINTILENINDFEGREIGMILQNILDVAFKKTGGLSLGVLEIKVLVNKLKSIDLPLTKELKTKVIEKIKQINDELKLAEKIIIPQLLEKTEEKESEESIEIEEKAPVETSIELDMEIDEEKVNALFDIFFEKIDELNGVQLSEQIHKIIDIVLEFQGFSDVVKWKKELLDLDEQLIDPVKEKLKEDFTKYKLGILKLREETKEPRTSSGVSGAEKKMEPMEQTEGFDIEDYVSPGLAQTSYTPDAISSTSSSSGSEKLNLIFKDIQDNLQTSIGPEISKNLQDIMDLILETVGYSMDLKDMKEWITKLRGIRKKLSEETRDQFLISFNKWKSKYSSEVEEEQALEFSTTLTIEDPLKKEKPQEGGKLKNLFDKVIDEAKTLNGSDLTNDLQEIADIVLLDQGAIAARDIRPWISKLRSIREPLEDEMKSELLDNLNKWKEKFL